jgi:cell wall-associated NlpC family hydrolase
MDEIIFTAPLTPLMLRPEPVGEMADEALCGMTASVVGEENGMLRVRMRYRYEGYVASGQVLRVTSAEAWEESASYRVISPAADILAEPLYETRILATLPRGAMLAVGGGETDWLSAKLADGTAGYVRSPSVRPARAWSGSEDARANVLADAKLYLGTQYRWGGKSPWGLDCSGLAGIAYMLNGLYIYRDARIVEGYPVKEIPAERGKPADLLFWPGHVAIYLGEGRYIHSTGRSSGVVINSLDPRQPDFREDLAGGEKWGSVFG